MYDEHQNGTGSQNIFEKSQSISWIAIAKGCLCVCQIRILGEYLCARFVVSSCFARSMHPHCAIQRFFSPHLLLAVR